MRLHLPSDIHIAKVGDDIVLLDETRDEYVCLPFAASQIRLQEGGAVDIAGRETAVALMAAGFLSSAAQPRREPPPLTPRRSLAPTNLEAGPVEAFQYLASLTDLRKFRRRALSDLIRQARPQGSQRPAFLSDPVLEAVAARKLATFQRWLPWTPGQGACLYRSFLLLRLLQRSGAGAVWVFGVRTWPFSAHCWLQIGDAVLDDDPDRVAGYTPIMAV